ncbi:MAG TPA: trimeric intracellular cation channel family protein [Edaphocola sp.]|nr:trimeric intracellular cation channel family protein [Edaphocola sp.]
MLNLHFVDILIYIGIFVFALTGSLKAREQEMDILGGIVLAFVTAYGGGTIRDLVLGIHPINWFNNNLSLALVFSASLIVFITKSNLIKIKKSILITDAIGLGMFTIGGIEKSFDYGANIPFALTLGVITATFGGLTADIISNREPTLLKSGEMYATVCAIGGACYLIMNRLEVHHELSMLIAVAITVLMRLWSNWKRWTIPKI